MCRSTVAIDTIMIDLLGKAWAKEGFIYNKEYGINMCRYIIYQSVINQLRTPSVFRENQAMF